MSTNEVKKSWPLVFFVENKSDQPKRVSLFGSNSDDVFFSKHKYLEDQEVDIEVEFKKEYYEFVKGLENKEETISLIHLNGDSLSKNIDLFSFYKKHEGKISEIGYACFDPYQQLTTIATMQTDFTLVKGTEVIFFMPPCAKVSIRMYASQTISKEKKEGQ